MDGFRHVVRVLRVSARAAEKRAGISGAQLFVLQQLAGGETLSIGDLALRTATDQSSVSVVVSRLVSAGHVTRRVAASDARRTELTLTDRGRALLRRAPRLAQTRLMASLRGVPAAQLRVTARVLERAARAVSPARAPAPMFFEPPAGKRRGGERKTGPRSGRGRIR